MPYAPTVNDRSGEIYADASNQAALLQLQGMQNFSQSLGNAMESMGKGYEKANENKMTSDYLDSMANHYSKVTDSDGKPLISQETLEIFSKSSLGKKQGIITPVQAKYDQMLQNSYIDRQMAAYLERSNQTATNQAALRQPAANQIPMGAGAPQVNSAAPASQPPAPAIGADIQTRSYFENP